MGVHYEPLYLFSELLANCYLGFDDPDIIPLTSLKGGGGRGEGRGGRGSLHVMEMWHGPSGSFKDLAMCVIGRLADYFLQQESTKATAVVSTSGDTGSAAIHSVLGAKSLSIVVMYPQGKITNLQRLQMSTVDAPNVRVYAVETEGDSYDEVRKKVLLDRDLASKCRTLSLNSVNIGRVLIQSFHYVYTYLRLCPTVGQEVEFFVPCGALGNITGGYIARLMGLPIVLHGVTNRNDVFHHTMTNGCYSFIPKVYLTLSSAIDIQTPYNIERLFYYWSGSKCSLVKQAMEGYERSGSSTLPREIVEASRKCMDTSSTTEEETLSTIECAWREFGYAVCPHTAVALHRALSEQKKEEKLETEEEVGERKKRKMVVMATATAAKFPEALAKVRVPPPPSAMLDDLSDKPEVQVFLGKDEDQVAVIKNAVEELQRA